MKHRTIRLTGGRFEEAQQALRSLAESVMSSLNQANDEVSKSESICSAIENGRVVNPPPDSIKVVGQ